MHVIKNKKPSCR